MTYDPRLASTTDLAELEAQITALDMQKANASTVGGLSTRMNAAESDIATKASVASLATKADASALAAKADTAAVATALAGKADVSALATKADTSALASKADASTVTALSSTVSSKASQAALDAVAAAMPVASTATPSSEAVAGMAGTNATKFTQEGHAHARLTSTTMGTIGAAGTATLTFTRSFAAAPGVVFTEIGGATGATAQPALGRSGCRGSTKIMVDANVEIYLRFRDRIAEEIDPTYYPIEWIDQEVGAGRIVLLATADSAILLALKTYPSGLKELHGMYALGNLLALRQDLIPQAIQFGKAIGCQVAVIESRSGWSRLMRAEGWENYQVSLRKWL